jgi:hypothetical protein
VITRAKRATTRYRPAVLLTICEAEASVKKIFLPRRYGEVMSDKDVESINCGKVKLNLVYKGVSTNGWLYARNTRKRCLKKNILYVRLILHDKKHLFFLL